MRQELIDTIWNAFTWLFQLFSNAFSSLWVYLADTPLWLLIDFIWWIFRFLYYGAKSIYYLVINLFSTVTWSVTYYLNGVFSTMGYFTWSSTSVFISLFQLVLILIVFSFIVRVILWKFHYNNKTKK